MFLNRGRINRVGLCWLTGAWSADGTANSMRTRTGVACLELSREGGGECNAVGQEVKSADVSRERKRHWESLFRKRMTTTPALHSVPWQLSTCMIPV